MIGRCLNCPVVFIDVDAFDAHQRAHNIPAASPNVAGAPLPTTHGSVSVERGNLARPADGLDTARHPSAGVRSRGGAA